MLEIKRAELIDL